MMKPDLQDSYLHRQHLRQPFYMQAVYRTCRTTFVLKSTITFSFSTFSYVTRVTPYLSYGLTERHLPSCQQLPFRFLPQLCDLRDSLFVVRTCRTTFVLKSTFTFSFSNFSYVICVTA